MSLRHMPYNYTVATATCQCFSVSYYNKFC